MSRMIELDDGQIVARSGGETYQEMLDKESNPVPDALRETIKHGTGDEEEDRRAHWDWADWAGHGIDRSGIAGVNQICSPFSAFKA